MASNLDIETSTRKFLSAYEQKDIAAIAGMFSTDVVLRDWNREVVGIEAAIEEYSKNFQAADTLEISINNLIVSGLSAAAVMEIVVNGIESLRVVDVVCFGQDHRILSVTAFKGL